MNADGVDEACESNEVARLSGGRVSNTWVTCRLPRNNSWKRLLIPDEVVIRKLETIKVGDLRTLR